MAKRKGTPKATTPSKQKKTASSEAQKSPTPTNLMQAVAMSDLQKSPQATKTPRRSLPDMVDRVMERFLPNLPSTFIQSTLVNGNRITDMIEVQNCNP